MDESSPEKKRVLYVITKAAWGGAQRYVFDLAVAAQANGCEAAVAYGEEGPLVAKLEAAGIKSVRIDTLARDVSFKAEVEAFKELHQLFTLSKPDVVHVNSSKGGLALLAARIARVPRIVFTAHGWAFNEIRPWWQKAVIRLAYVATIYLSHTTICVSEAIRRDMRWLPFASKKFVTIHHGIRKMPLKSRVESRRALAPNLRASTWMGMIAELHPSKRVEDAIRAFYELKNEYPYLGLVIIGSGQEHERLQAYIEAANLENEVVLAGFMPHAGEYLSAFDIFLITSRTEALGYALLEAGAANLPVIATRVGGIPEVVVHKRSGLLVPPNNPPVLARTIRTLLDDKNLAKELADALTKRVDTVFAEDRMIRDTLAQY